MEVTKNQIDDLNIELTIALKAEDYAEQEKKRLSAYRRNADFKGFRKGMVPASLVKKVHGAETGIYGRGSWGIGDAAPLQWVQSFISVSAARPPKGQSGGRSG